MGVPPKDPTPWASEHPVVVGRTDASMFGVGGNRSQVSLQALVEPTVQERASVHWQSFVPETMSSAQKKFLQHRFNRRCIGAYHRCNDVSVQEKIPSAPDEPMGQKGASVQWPSYVPETMSSAQEKFLQHRFNRRCIGVLHRCIDVSRREEGCE